MQITIFDPPAAVDDFDSRDQRKAWSGFIAYHFDQNVGIVAKELVENGAPPGTAPQFYNPLADSAKTEPDQVLRDVPWSGFPRVLTVRYSSSAQDVGEELATGTLGYDSDGNEIAYTYRKQDEYLEWYTIRDDKTGKVTKIQFTCEAPEYWSALAQGIPSPYYSLIDDGTTYKPSVGTQGNLGHVVQLYRALTGEPKITGPDLIFATDIFDDDKQTNKLFSKGDYNPWNTYNTKTGAVHLTHPANTLGAEINLAARASIRRAPGGNELTDNTGLICCGAYGNANRNSDPTIGGTVNIFARSDAFVTLLNPVGLYMTDFSGAALTTPDGTPAEQFWKWVRPTAQLPDGFKRYLRAVFEVPTAKGYVVGDIKLANANGANVHYGGQLAQFITMMLVGAVDRIGQRKVAPIGCVAHGCRSALNSGYTAVLRNRKDQNGVVTTVPCASLGDFNDVGTVLKPTEAFLAAQLPARAYARRQRLAR